jgi:hypothetical protein
MTEPLSSNHSLYVCPDCKNQFAQPFTCITCGAQRLYDETVRQQGRQIETQAAEIERQGCVIVGIIENANRNESDLNNEIERLRGLFETAVKSMDSCGCEWERDPDDPSKHTDKIDSLCLAHEEYFIARLKGAADETREGTA